MDIAQFFASFPAPPVAELLGWEFAGWDEKARAFSVRFDGKPGFANPAGVIQGGILTAMMDDTMGPAVVAASGGTRFCQTIDLHAHFLRPVRPGSVRCTARVVQLGHRVAFIEAELFDAEDRLCMKGSSSASLADMPG